MTKNEKRKLGLSQDSSTIVNHFLLEMGILRKNQELFLLQS